MNMRSKRNAVDEGNKVIHAGGPINRGSLDRIVSRGKLKRSVPMKTLIISIITMTLSVRAALVSANAFLLIGALVSFLMGGVSIIFLLANHDSDEVLIGRRVVAKGGWTLRLISIAVSRRIPTWLKDSLASWFDKRNEADSLDAEIYKLRRRLIVEPLEIDRLERCLTDMESDLSALEAELAAGPTDDCSRFLVDMLSIASLEEDEVYYDEVNVDAIVPDDLADIASSAVSLLASLPTGSSSPSPAAVKKTMRIIDRLTTVDGAPFTETVAVRAEKQAEEQARNEMNAMDDAVSNAVNRIEQHLDYVESGEALALVAEQSRLEDIAAKASDPSRTKRLAMNSQTVGGVR